MIVVVFRSRVRPETAARYNALADKMEQIARAMPGFISYKGFIAEDGEHISIHEWETPEHLRAWREHPEHAKAQELGRQEFYEEYNLQVCENPRVSKFQRREPPTR